MRPFEKVVHCPKCDTIEEARLVFHEGNGTCPLLPEEHIHRTCRVCAHEWAEKPADAPQA
jgi:hypothetical protein